MKATTNNFYIKINNEVEQYAIVGKARWLGARTLMAGSNDLYVWEYATYSKINNAFYFSVENDKIHKGKMLSIDAFANSKTIKECFKRAKDDKNEKLLQ